VRVGSESTQAMQSRPGDRGVSAAMFKQPKAAASGPPHRSGPRSSRVGAGRTRVGAGHSGPSDSTRQRVPITFLPHGSRQPHDAPSPHYHPGHAAGRVGRRGARDRLPHAWLRWRASGAGPRSGGRLWPAADLGRGTAADAMHELPGTRRGGLAGGGTRDGTAAPGRQGGVGGARCGGVTVGCPRAATSRV
jgi:hypothetical protein